MYSENPSSELPLASWVSSLEPRVNLNPEYDLQEKLEKSIKIQRIQ